VRIAPTSGTAWTNELQVYLVSDTQATPTALRKVAAMSSGATLVADNNATAIDFNNLGALIAPAAAVTMTYTRGTISKTIKVCLTGRITLGGGC
jgi:type IV fimbrial biogenesis protein FimU